MKLETGRGGGAGVLLAMVAYYGLYNIFQKLGIFLIVIFYPFCRIEFIERLK